MALLFLVFFLGVSDNQMVSPLLPLLAGEFKMQPGDAGKLIGPAYALAAALAALVVGPASDKLGRKRFLLYAAVVFGFSLMAVFAIRDIRTLTAVRFLTGLAAGTFSTCSVAYTGDYFPYARRGMAMSIVNSGYFAALVVGVPLGTTLAQHRGWRFGFGAFGLISLAAFFSLLFFLPDDSATAHPGLPLGDKQGRLHHMGEVFATTERVAAVVAAFFVSGGFVGFILYLGSWLMKSYGLNPIQVGRVLIVVGVTSLIGAVAVGPLADRFGKRTLSLVSTLALAGSLFAIPRIGWSAALLAAFLVASLSFAFRQGPLQALATELIPKHARGSLVAARTTSSQLGIAVAAAACGVLYDRFGYGAVGEFSAILTLGAAVCIYLMREPEGPAHSDSPA